MKSGRPKEYQHRVIFTTSLEKDLVDRFKDLSNRDKKNMNAMLEVLMEKHLAEHESGNEQYTLDNPVYCTPAFFRDFAIINNYFSTCSEEEASKHKFKLQEWNQAFKNRYGESAL